MDERRYSQNSVQCRKRLLEPLCSTSLREHIITLIEVFERLRGANFKTQLDKYEFLKKEVFYLGHIVLADGVKPIPEKIRAI